jgi:hypothetical protein
VVHNTTLTGSLLAIGATAHTLYNARVLRTPRSSNNDVAERISILIPARNEANNIGACVAAVLRSTKIADFEVVVLDDGSTDNTAALATAAAQSDPRFRLIHGEQALPDGWLGKNWACERLAKAACGSVLVFIDADVVVAADGIANSVTLMREVGLDVICPYPTQDTDGVLGRLVQPLLQWSWLTLLPLGAAESSQQPSLTAANGQLLIIDSAMYARMGGHESVRGDVLEDIALVRAVKSTGGRGGVVDGTNIARCRMYETAGDLIDGYSKSLWSAFGSPAGSASVVALLNLMYVVPPIAALTSPRASTRTWGAIGYAAGVAGRAVSAERTGGRTLPDVLAHPASIVAFSGLVAESWRRRRNGTATWRGRTLP